MYAFEQEVGSDQSAFVVVVKYSTIVADCIDGGRLAILEASCEMTDKTELA